MHRGRSYITGRYPLLHKVVAGVLYYLRSQPPPIPHTTLDPTTYPYSCWSPDGPNAARRTSPGKPQFEFPHAAPSEVPYSPRGKILHRTILKRRELLRSFGLETRMVIIEVGPKAYVSKMSLEELHAHGNLFSQLNQAAIKADLTIYLLDRSTERCLHYCS